MDNKITGNALKSQISLLNCSLSEHTPKICDLSASVKWSIEMKQKISHLLGRKSLFYQAATTLASFCLLVLGCPLALLLSIFSFNLYLFPYGAMKYHKIMI